MDFVFFKFNKEKAFSLVEVLVSLALFSIILLAVLAFFVSMNNSSQRTKADREVSENAKKVLDRIAFEIRAADSIYTPTTTSTQLSLQTTRYLPAGEISTFIDFFLCGTSVCIKRESQDPIALNSDSVEVTSLTFSQLNSGSNPSVKIDLSVSHNNSAINFTSTAGLRSYNN